MNIDFLFEISFTGLIVFLKPVKLFKNSHSKLNLTTLDDASNCFTWHENFE
eukprot:UN07617